MKHFYFFAFAALLVCAFGCEPTKTKQMKDIPTPIAEKKEHKMVAHGDTRIDNYFWMRLTDEQKTAETPDGQTQKVLNYLNAENDYTKKQLQHTEALQDTLYNEIVGRIKQQDESVPYLKNNYWYYSRYEVGKEYPIYCRKFKTLDAEEKILLDVNRLAAKHDYYAAVGLSVSPDNKILAFGEDTVSRRVYTVRFLNLETGEFLKDELQNTEGSGAWANDNKTFFFTTKNTTTLLSEKVYRHTLGEDSNELVYHEKDPTYYIGVYKSKSSDYVIIWNKNTLSSDFRILDANTPKGEFKQFTPREKVHEYSIDHFQDKFYVVTNWNAKNFRLMETAANATEKSNWKEIVPHRADVFLENVDVFKNFLVLEERKMGNTQIRVIDQESKNEHYLNFGEEAYLASTTANVEFDTENLRFYYSSMTTPGSTFDYNMRTKKKDLKKQQEVVGGHQPEQYETKRLFATARDGKKVPISIVYKKGYEPNGNAPLLLYAYGSYGANMDPYFSSVRLSLLNRGFAYAIAHIRGGEFLGREWYEGGKMLNKKNTFYDYIDCAKFLIDNKYTSQEKIFAMGGSAGGLLMGAVINYEPTLFKGVIAAVPFVDVVSTMSDPTIPLTTNEYDEWGNPENKEYYEYMKSYSPYDNIEAKEYTNLLITTGLFDSQVQYWEPAKWIAKLREMKTDNNLLMMHTNMEAGHGGASGRFKRYKETALEYAFMMNLVGIEK